MPTNCISFRDTNYFSSLICDYLDENPKLKSLYGRFPNLENFKVQIEEKSLSVSSHSRSILAKTLKSQYQNIEASELTITNIESLKSEKTFTITTGHQLNLFTGPLYFLHKIVSTINLTKELKEAYPDYNFVPIYWMASEDHDFDEINYFNFRGKKIQWNREDGGAVGRFDTNGLADVLDIVSAEFGPGRHAEQLKKLFRDAYVNHNNLADATRYLANTLFAEYGLVILDADDKELKRLFIPQMQKELLEQTAYKTVSKTNKKIEELGLNIQVNPREINLFYLDKNLRERIVFETDTFKVNNTDITWTKDELIKHLNDEPERFSPNVIIRPLYQEAILPNLCYIGGGGELAYWFQLKSNFETQNVTFPILLLRNSVLIKTEKQAKKQEALGISESHLFLKRDSFINKRVRNISNIDIDFSEQLEHLQKQFHHLYTLAEQTDKSFIGAVDAQVKKQVKGLQHLEKRLLKAQKIKLKDEIERATDLQNQLFPNNSLQERNTNFSESYLEFGDALIPELIDSLKPLKGEFTIITM
ncbi:bacillithiol biosynthesis cysteine-adding enzyme BshC [Winogradskyella sp. PC-19]|uniref:bacillithiol biosynthesis cysteine-adding enzyme BshC n=1 Tax=unclassified Winogradskyella TaxID=2615021 RepID=UPI000B3C5425|nr:MULTISPECIES: bacillithiol biosynthesis cysteine-adding enzyme BshC [unclassified Winogradskyella]ARV08991.1 bacillithiol biosynthesis cysteine-adding enzyme BshC [Winogradskyella sp. PC-19]RZN79402.1 MAG: bacillithiol biosynthesis cysteine-adding enzyme BshC [Winogradskyella sp.]